MKKMIQLMIFLISIMVSNVIFSAGVIVSSEFPTTVTLFLDSGVVRTKKIESVSGRVEIYMKIIGYLPKPGYGEKVFITDAVFAGFKKIQWNDTDGHMYEASLGIPGIFGFRTVRIFKDNNVVIDDADNPGSFLFHKEVQGTRIN